MFVHDFIIFLKFQNLILCRNILYQVETRILKMKLHSVIQYTPKENVKTRGH